MCGFEVEGTLKDHYFIDGRYRSALLMAKFLS
jgi:RimJ/RimL family protein N-acetyltransferase